MASNTPNLNLLKKDPLTDGNETFNIQTMMNDNWDKIDTAVKKVQDDVANIDPDIPDASTTQKGIVQLSSATNSASETLAATAKAVKTVADASLPKTGGTVSGDISISGKSTLVGPIDFRNGMDGLGDIKNTGGIRANGIVNFTNRLFVGSGDNNGQPSLSLSIGDNDTGFNHNSDGYVDLISNGRTVAYMKDGRFVVRGDGDDFYDVARDIINLKQSGVSRKQELVNAINANGGSASNDQDFSGLINNLNNITRTRYKEGSTTGNNGIPNSNSDWVTLPSGFYKKVTARSDFMDSSRVSLGNFSVGSNSSITFYALDSAGRQVDLLTFNLQRSITVTGFRAFQGGAGIATYNSGDNVGRWSDASVGGFDMTGGVRFRYRITGTVNASLGSVSGAMTAYGG
ncbi:hypothetical protein QE450_000462 [Paenibacillus sp. SORGH_AS306]|nr:MULTISPECIES: phage tail protein [unclassified Paenibacillus]MDQ1232964.1 hypothetical protein [Paenibacillus sp. SORGH_AS_0306]MDR6110010.1 hypothetical protein [Paenibacillus sp. SORGH_AS_0338]